jgi:hypothetical protein
MLYSIRSTVSPVACEMKLLSLDEMSDIVLVEERQVVSSHAGSGEYATLGLLRRHARTRRGRTVLILCL